MKQEWHPPVWVVKHAHEPSTNAFVTPLIVSIVGALLALWLIASSRAQSSFVMVLLTLALFYITSRYGNAAWGAFLDILGHRRAKHWLRLSWTSITCGASPEREEAETWMYDTAEQIFSPFRTEIVMEQSSLGSTNGYPSRVTQRTVALEEAEVAALRTTFENAREVGMLLGFWDETRTLDYYNPHYKTKASA